MADKKISELTPLTGANLADNDEFAVVDTSATETKAITFGELKTALDTSTGFVRITGDTMTGDLNLSGADVIFGDNDKAIFGAGSDLEIYHDGSNSNITDVGTGNLRLRGENLVLQNSDSTKNYLLAINGGATSVYFNNVTKLATTATGVDVTGDIGADTATISGNLTVDTNTLFVDAANNRVGVGTATPATNLHIDGGTGQVVQVGPLSLTNFADEGSGVIFGRATDGALTQAIGTVLVDSLGVFGRENIVLATGGSGLYGATSERMRITSTGNVGIGTSSPADKLSLEVGAANQGLSLYYSGVEVGSFRSDAGNATLNANNASLKFATGGSERMRITSTGSVGIGTSSPSANLHIADTALTQLYLADTGEATDQKIWGFQYGTGVGTGTFRLRALNDAVNNGQNAYIITRTGFSVDTHQWITAGNERMRITSTGSVGIGTSNPLSPLVVAEGTGQHGFEVQPGTLTYVFAYDRATADYGDLDIAGQTLRFSTDNGVERARIDASGNLLVGTTVAPSSGNGGSGFIVDTDSRRVLELRSNANGSLDLARFYTASGLAGSISSSFTSTAYNTSSDYRLKEDVQPMVGSVGRLMALKPVNFAWKAGGSRVDGFLAHEVQAFVPEAVTGEKDAVDDDNNPVYQGIDQSKLVPLLTAALQEALTEIADLKARITALEA